MERTASGELGGRAGGAGAHLLLDELHRMLADKGDVRLDAGQAVAHGVVGHAHEGHLAWGHGHLCCRAVRCVVVCVPSPLSLSLVSTEARLVCPGR